MAVADHHAAGPRGPPRPPPPRCLGSLTLGTVGLPDVGESTLFNALTHNDVLAANHPSATIEPSVGVIHTDFGRACPG